MNCRAFEETTLFPAQLAHSTVFVAITLKLGAEAIDTNLAGATVLVFFAGGLNALFVDTFEAL